MNNLTLEAFYPDPPERVWRALTDAGALSRWLMPTDFRPQIGFRFKFTGSGHKRQETIESVVLDVERGKRLMYTWDDGEDDAPGIVSWTLKPKDGGTLLTLEHRAPEAAEPYVLIEASANWSYAIHASLPILMRLLGSEQRYPKAPIVYVAEEPQAQDKVRRRAGFRQEVGSCN